MLGKEPTVEGNANEDIEPVLRDLKISDGPYTMDEYLGVKKSLVEGKSPGPDGIAPEVLKRCNMDDIFLGYANQLL